MIVKKYTGSNETEAVLKAKDDLGPNAVVLNVKTMKQRGLAQLFKKDYVEITAALEEKEFAQTVNNKKPSFDAVVKNSAMTTPTPMYDMRVDEKTVPRSKTSEVIEEKLDNIHNMIRNQMDRE